jgi:hypothetical protein
MNSAILPTFPPSIVLTYLLVQLAQLRGPTHTNREISKFNPMFARLTRDVPKFASLSKFNPRARELFDSGAFHSFFRIS